MSDYGATHNVSTREGFGLEQGSKKPVFSLQDIGKNITALDTAVFKILTASFQTGIYDYPSNGTFLTNVTSEADKKIAQ